MSSSPASEPLGFQRFLERGFAALERELPEVLRRMCREIAPRRLSVCVSGEEVELVFAEDRVQSLAGRPQHAAVRLVTDDRTILDLADARLDFTEAVLSERLWLAGAPRDVVAFFQGLMIYFHGAVRSREFPRLLAEWREQRVRAQEQERERR